MNHIPHRRVPEAYLQELVNIIRSVESFRGSTVGGAVDLMVGINNFPLVTQTGVPWEQRDQKDDKQSNGVDPPTAGVGESPPSQEGASAS